MQHFEKSQKSRNHYVDRLWMAGGAIWTKKHFQYVKPILMTLGVEKHS